MPRRAKKEKPLPIARARTGVVSSHVAGLCSLGISATVFIVYLLTLMPTVLDQDSGELVAAAHVLGVPHPTGYPLWTMLARAFDFLPVGHTSAYRIALLSAASAAAAAGLLAWITVSITGLLLPAIFTGLAFGFWFPTWSQAVRAEVYALEGLLFSLFLLAFWCWDRERSPKCLPWLAFAGGFASMHHRTAFLAVAPSLAAAFWLTRPRRAKVWASAAMLFAAPFLCYLYLPVRAAVRPPLNWGNPDTFARFLSHVLGRQYSRWAFSNSIDVVMQQGARLLGESLAGEVWLSVVLALVGAPLIIWGFTFWYRRRPVVVGSLAVGCVLLCAWVLEWGDTSDSKVWLTPVGAVTALFGGLGLARASELLARRKAGRYLTAGLGMLVCIILLSANWDRSDQSNVWLHRDHWLAALSQMDENAVFIAEWDAPMFVTYYLQNVEGLRKDITQLRPHGLWQSWYVDLIPDAELRRTSEELWQEITSEFSLRHPGTPEFWEGTALFAYRLAQHYRGRRTVYALHGPALRLIPGPPYFVGLNEDLYRLDFEMPNLLRSREVGEPIAQFPGGIELVSLEFGMAEAYTGEMVDFCARWELESPLSGTLFGLELVPTRGPSSARESVSEAYMDRLAAKGDFVQGFPLLYGLWGLASSPPGTVYEQKGRLMIPSNAPAGGYGVKIGFARSYPPHYQDWTELGNEDWLIVRARPLPTNRP